MKRLGKTGFIFWLFIFLLSGCGALEEKDENVPTYLCLRNVSNNEAYLKAVYVERDITYQREFTYESEFSYELTANTANIPDLDTLGKIQKEWKQDNDIKVNKLFRAFFRILGIFFIM